MSEYSRDHLGRFASASSLNGGGVGFGQPAGEIAPNGGGNPNFGGEGFEYPETRDALLKFATSKPSKAPTMTGSTYEPPEQSDAGALLDAATPDGNADPGEARDKFNERLAKGGVTADSLRDDVFGSAPEVEHAPALRAMGYHPPEGPPRPDISRRFGTPMPPPVHSPAGAHPQPRIHFGGFSGQTPRPSGNGNGGEDPDFGGIPDVG